MSQRVSGKLLVEQAIDGECGAGLMTLFHNGTATVFLVQTR